MFDENFGVKTVSFSVKGGMGQRLGAVCKVKSDNFSAVNVGKVLWTCRIVAVYPTNAPKAPQ